MRRWYCIQCKPRKEFFAKGQLERQGFDPFLPTETQTRTYTHNVKKQMLVPLFGPYMFVPFDVDADHWKPIASSYGVKRIFGTSPETPSPVPDMAIESLLNCVVPTATVRGLIHPGTRVRIVSGPFSRRIDGEQTIGLCSWTRGRRAALLLEAMNGQIEVAFDLDSLEAVETTK